MNNLKLSHILIIIFSLIFVGITGYMVLENWNFTDSLYMTMITITTTGFKEVRELSPYGKYFTMGLMVLGIAMFAYFATALMALIVGKDFEKRRREKMNKKIAELKNHTIICGFGRIGQVICRELASQKAKFVVIEKKADHIALLKKTNYFWIEGDAANDDNLFLAGVKKAKVIASMIDSDADGLYIALASRSINPKLHIVVRAEDEAAKKRILRAGADKVILPIIMSGKKIAESIINPAVEDFLDITGASVKGKRIQLADLLVLKGSSLIGQDLETKGPEMPELIIVGVRKPDEQFVFFPKKEYVFQEGDCLISMGTKESYQDALHRFSLDTYAPAL
ncbi:MAG: NAD-binding protein [Bacteriovoracaceae bacterium]|nr:NAD-binding protein [Bacteriovoracaceae bacterium]